ncbi:hypothetical protein VSR01_16550 [Actinacidiphila sp. DG2A-62]|uniref:hypothetical protein n=1 Tax=Actinacidiphila sp. DG2A-62 TaxID=3108821 RepID=UPI002DBA1BB8|nr:hypothetical protein [Actinacidiphila sp. DG2A-62]MEC3995057.1 hypothetical protein [Actinacidiphila sp. DG2A-62]
MNRDLLPELGAALRKLGAFTTQRDVTDATLAHIATELDRARALVAAARGNAAANRCTRHPGGPVDPAGGGTCLLCRTRRPAPARSLEPPTAAVVLAAIDARGEQAATQQYGGHAVTRALALGHRTRPAKPHPNPSTTPTEETRCN